MSEYETMPDLAFLLIIVTVMKKTTRVKNNPKVHE